MCKNCLPYRDHETTCSTHAAHTAPAPEASPIGSVLRRPISRGQLLKAVGGGVGAALTAGALGWSLGLADAVSMPYVVLIVLDGARPEYFSIPGIPHVAALMKSGTQYSNAFAGILEAETPAAHVSIGTGSEPRNTGIPSFWWATADNVQVSLFSPTKIREGDMEKIVRQARVPTLAGRVHAKSRNAKVVALSGSKYYAADAIGGPDADITMYFQGNSKGQWAPTYIPGHAAPAAVLNAPGVTYPHIGLPPGVQNHLAMQLAIETFNRVRQQVTLINLPEFDWPLGHVNGGVLDPSGIKTLMHTFDSDLAALQEAYRKAGVLNRTVFVLMSDHGMMPLHQRLPQTDFTSAVTNAGTSLVSQAYTSGIYLWVKDSSRATKAAQNIAGQNNQYVQSVYARVHTSKGYVYNRVSSAKSLRSGGTEAANQYLLNSFNGSVAPDIVVSLAEGVGCEPGGQAGWKADHGGPSWQSQHLPLVISGPGIRSGYVSSYPARLIDVAPTILQLMGGSHQGMQGIPLADALVKPPSWTVQWQKTAAKTLVPAVAALQQQSQLELKAGV
jgi:hypothetical protein